MTAEEQAAGACRWRGFPGGLPPDPEPVAEAVLAGESPELETTEYVRDAVAAGKRKAIVFLGHRNSEEGGMEYCACRLKTIVHEVPVKFVPAGDPFWSPR